MISGNSYYLLLLTILRFLFFRYLCSCGLDLNFAYTHSAVVPQKVDSIDSVYNFLVSVLPENIKETRRKKALHDEEVRKAKLRQQEKVRKQREDQAREAFEAELKQMEEVARAKRQKEEQKIEAEKAQKRKQLKMFYRRFYLSAAKILVKEMLI